MSCPICGSPLDRGFCKRCGYDLYVEAGISSPSFPFQKKDILEGSSSKEDSSFSSIGEGSSSPFDPIEDFSRNASFSYDPFKSYKDDDWITRNPRISLLHNV